MAAVLVFASGCGDDSSAGSGGGAATASASSSSTASTISAGGAGGGEAGTVVLEGAVQKGPFILGSSIVISVLDEELRPTGENFQTTTSNDLGEFEAANLPLAPLSISGSGFYYNEVLGDLSGAELTLRALHLPAAAGEQRAFVNVVTHLTEQRIATLVDEGATFAEASLQAEDELRSELDITLPDFDPGASAVEMNLAGGDTDANAYLFAVSSLFVQIAVDADEGSVEATLQQTLNAAATALAGGTLPASAKERVTAALSRLNLPRIEEEFAARLESLGSTAAVPHMGRILDQDRDGVIHDVDNCPRVANSSQENADDDGTGDACDSCPDTSCRGGCIPAAQIGGEAPADLCAELCDVDGYCAEGTLCVYFEEGSFCGVDVCGSGVVWSYPDQGECMSLNCCVEVDICTNGGEDVLACIDCLNGGGGVLCNDVQSCAEGNCSG